MANLKSILENLFIYQEPHKEHNFILAEPASSDSSASKEEDSRAYFNKLSY
ncbi:MAG: hypothetical protein FWC79_08145 [Oscillospiraceae bacterium]|nr:hypothetical protein [Oscillospiraceae bacterium]